MYTGGMDKRVARSTCGVVRRFKDCRGCGWIGLGQGRLGEEDLDGRVGDVVLSLGLGDGWRWGWGGLSVGVLAWS